MTSTRAVIAVAAAAGALLLTACGGADADTERTATGTTTSDMAASTGTSTAASAPASPTTTSDPTSTAPAAAESPASAAEPTPTAAPPAPVTAAPPAPRLARNEIDSRSPDQIVADSGERGQRYLAALRAAGIPPTGMDAAEVLYAQGTCDALARGDSRASVLAEFDSVGKAYAQFLPMSANRIAEIYVSTAETTYC